jgi:hypothetical protein
MNLKSLIVIGLLCAGSLLDVSAEASANECGPIKVVLRHDDYTQTSPASIEEKLLNGANLLGAKVVVGVVPFKSDERLHDANAIALSEEKVDLLKRYVTKGTVQIAVHGYRHESNSTSAQKSEFTVPSRQVQRAWLDEAKKAVEGSFGVEVSAFVPPWNQHGEATLKALADSGYQIISSAGSRVALAEVPLSYLPGTVYPQSFLEAVHQSVKKGICDGIIVVTSHPYDFDEEKGIPEFRSGEHISVDKFIKQLGDLSAGGVVTFVSMDDLIQTSEDLGHMRLSLNRLMRENWIARHYLLPRMFNLMPVEHVYYSARGAFKVLTYQVVAAFLIYGTVLWVMALIAHLMLKNCRVSVCVVFSSFALLLITSVVIIVGLPNVFIKWAMIIMSLAGISIGAGIAGISTVLAGNHVRTPQ